MKKCLERLKKSRGLGTNKTTACKVKAFLPYKAQPGFKPGFSVFALAFIAQFHPNFWNLKSRGSI